MYDVIIIGGSAAGTAAAIYLARRKMNFLMISEDFGGEVATSGEIGNYPGFPSTNGIELTEKFREHLKAYNIEPELEVQVKSVKKLAEGHFVVEAEKNGTPLKYEAKSIIVASGSRPRQLNVPGEKEFRGKGLSYCTVCLPPGSYIVANNEPKDIAEVAIGDRVLTHDGTYQQVSRTMSRNYRGELIRIKTRFFIEDEVRLTPNHPVLARRLEKGRGPNYRKFRWGKPQWVPAGELLPDYLLGYPIPSETRDTTEITVSHLFGVPVEGGMAHNQRESPTARRIPNKIAVEGGFLRLLGYYLAEGSINGYTTIFYFGAHEKEYVNDVVRLIKRYFKIAPHVRIEGSVVRIEICSTLVAKVFEGLAGKRSYDKALQEHWLSILPLPKQKELIRGLWRGDGCKKSKGFLLVTNSFVLATQVKNILLRFGILPEVRKIDLEKLRATTLSRRKIYFRHAKYEITVGGPWLEPMAKLLGVNHPKVHQRKRICYHAHFRDGFVWLPIRSIVRESYSGTVYNLAVKRNHSYVTANSAVHNCDGPLFKDKVVVTIGGGDSANESGIMMNEIASKVYVLTKNPDMKGDPSLIARLKAGNKVTIIPNANTTRIIGENFVTGVEYEDVNTKEKKTIDAQGVFVHIGMIPNTQFLPPEIAKNPYGELIVEKNSMQTSITGIFAAGDNTDIPFKQIGIAVGQGIIAALAAVTYVNKLDA